MPATPKATSTAVPTITAAPTLASGTVVTIPCAPGATTVTIGRVTLACPLTVTVVSGSVTPNGGSNVIIGAGSQIRLSSGATLTLPANLVGVLGATLPVTLPSTGGGYAASQARKQQRATTEAGYALLLVSFMHAAAARLPPDRRG